MTDLEETLAPTEWQARSAIVDPDFGGFHLWWTEGDANHGLEAGNSPTVGAGILRAFGSGGLMLSSRSKHGPIRVRVGRHRSRPEALGEEWADVAEHSVPFVPHMTLSGPEFALSWSTIIPLVGGEQRVRYGVRPGEEPAGDDEVGEYRLDFWPEEPSDPTLIRESVWGAYWNREHAIDLAAKAYRVGSGGDLGELFEGFVRRVFEHRPDLRPEVASEGQWRARLLRESLAAWPRQFEQGQREAILDRILSGA